MDKTEFTAVFERHEAGKVLFEGLTHFRDVRSGESSNIIAKKVVFNAETSNKIIGHLTLGEYVTFLADVEFKNIEFKYPHGKLIEN